MKHLIILLLSFFLLGCSPISPKVQETPEGFRINEYSDLTVILQTPLSSKINKRGDSFTTKLKNPLIFKGKMVLPPGSELHGLVKTVKNPAKAGEKASLMLLFDRLALPNGKELPLRASLDTNKGAHAIKIPGKEMKDAAVLGGGAIVGAIIGKSAIKDQGIEKGLLIGAMAGAGAVILGNMAEIKLPKETEFKILLEEAVLVPKSINNWGYK